MTKPFLVVSDTHLGAVPDDTERKFRAFLNHAGSAASGLLINGDLFDFWFEYRSVIPRQHYRVPAALREVVEAGVPIWFVAGNHDAWAGRFLSEDVGLTLANGPLEMELAGRRALIAHGDGVGTGDLGYRVLRKFIRHPATVGAFRMLHPDIGARIAARVSSTDQKTAGAPDSRSRADFIRNWGTAQLRQRPEIDLVLAGHAHIPEVLEVERGRYFINSGDWVHNHSYISIPDAAGPPELLRWR